MAESTGDWSLYPYEPNKPAPIISAALLAVLMGYQIYQSFFHYKWKKFGGAMTWASVVWITGFVARSVSVFRVQDISVFITQYVLILMGPPLYSAAEYFILARLLAYLPYYTPLHPGRVFSTFILLSAVVETLTGAGAGNSAGTGRTELQRTIGLNLVKAALILQCFVEAFFISLVAVVEYRCRKGGLFPSKIRKVCIILYITSLMILVRCIVRTVEGFEAASCDADRPDPYCGPVSRNEWFLWVFEIANITLFVILLAIFHPGKYLPRSSRVFLDPVDGRTDRLGPGFSEADKRPRWLTVVDPFNIHGVFSGKSMDMSKFWEEPQPIFEGQHSDRGVPVRVEEEAKTTVSN